MDATSLALIVLVVTQFGQIAAAWVQRRATPTEKQVVDRDGLVTANTELRTEMARKDAEHQRDITKCRVELAAALRDVRAANEATGLVVRRVHHLEGLLRNHGIEYGPGPLA